MNAMACTRLVPAAPTATLSVGSYDNGNGLVRAATTAEPGWADIVSYRFDFGDGTTVTSTDFSCNHTYLAGGSLTARVTVTDALSLATTATTQVQIDVSLALLSDDLRHVSAERAGADPLVADRAAVGAWEIFQPVYGGDGYLALRSPVNGRYVAVDPANGARLAANATTIEARTLFQLVSGADGVAILRSVLPGNYLSDNGGRPPMAADRTAIGPWEEFIGPQPAPTS